MKTRPTSTYSSAYSSAKKDGFISGPAITSSLKTASLLRPQSSEIAKKIDAGKTLLKGPELSGNSKLVSHISQEITSKLAGNKFQKGPSRTIGGTNAAAMVKSPAQYKHSSTLDQNNSTKASGRLSDLFGEFERKIEYSKKSDSTIEAIDKIKQTQRLTSKDGVPSQHPRIRPTNTTFSNRKYSEIKNSSLYNIYNNKTADKRGSLLDQMRGIGTTKTESKYTGIQDLDSYKQYSKLRSEQLNREKLVDSRAPVEKRITYSENGDAQLDSELQEADINQGSLQGDLDLGVTRRMLLSEDAGDLGNLELAIESDIRLPIEVRPEFASLHKELTSPVNIRPESDPPSKARDSSLEELRQEISRLRSENTHLKQELGSERALLTQQIKQLDEERRKLDLMRTEASAEMECAKTEWSKIKSTQQEIESRLKEINSRDETFKTQQAQLQAEVKEFQSRKESEIKSSDVHIEFNIKQGVQIAGSAQLVDSGVEIDTGNVKPNAIQNSDPFDAVFSSQEAFKFDFLGGSSQGNVIVQDAEQSPTLDQFGDGWGSSPGDGFFGEQPQEKKKKNLIFESMIDGHNDLAKLSDYHSVSPYDQTARDQLDAALKQEPSDSSIKATQIVQADSFILDEDGNDPSQKPAWGTEDQANQANITNGELSKLRNNLEQAEKAKQRREADCSTLNARILSIEADMKKMSQTVSTLSCHNAALQNLVYQLGKDKASMRERLVQLKSTSVQSVPVAEENPKILGEPSHPRVQETIKSAATGENQTGRQGGFFDEHDFVAEEPNKPSVSKNADEWWGEDA